MRFSLFDLLGIPQTQEIMAGPATPKSSQDDSPGSNIFGALGTVLGYIGAEAETVSAFERLLWPQRYYSNFNLHSALGVAFLTSMSGPKHKIALAVLDKIYYHGLFKGFSQGHMLGTSFFPQKDCMYMQHQDCGEHKAHTEPVRNCVWIRALSYLPMLPAQGPAATQSPDQVEKGGQKEPQILRARVAVSHLTFSRPTATDLRQPDLPFVSEDTKTPSGRVFLGIMTSELCGILTALGIFAGFRSPWALLWLMPLLIRLVSSFCSLHREGLISAISSSAANEESCDFEIMCPQSDGNFMLFSGPPVLVLQFFRHYGHPKRNRFREITQFIVVGLFVCLFSVELLCSMTWMPLELQYIWLVYHLYVVVMMHVARYSHYSNLATTEAKIADAFNKQVSAKDTAGTGRQCSILFGHCRDGPETLKVDLWVTYHGRNKEGKEQLVKLLQRHTTEVKTEVKVEVKVDPEQIETTEKDRSARASWTENKIQGRGLINETPSGSESGSSNLSQ